LQVNDLFSRTPTKEYWMFAIVGLASVLYGLLSSRLPTNFLIEPTTPTRRRINRAIYFAVSMFMLVWGVVHLAETPRGGR
jgi:hypothetical protein